MTGLIHRRHTVYDSSEPHQPTCPEKIILSQKTLYIEGKTLKDILNMIPKDIPLDEVKVINESYNDHCLINSSSPAIIYYIKSPNPNYKQEYKIYEQKLEIYEQEMKLYHEMVKLKKIKDKLK